MKEPLIRSLFILSLVLILYSCETDGLDGQEEVEDQEEVDGQEVMDSQSLFTIHASEVQGFSGDRLVMATSPISGELLFWDVMTSFADSITFEVDSLETVDITYASEYETGFGITTYRDVKSGFKLSRFLYPCYEDQYYSDTLVRKSVELVIPGTKEILEFNNPAFSHSDLPEINGAIIDEDKKIIYDLDNDVTIIKGFLGSTIVDHQFVFRFSGEQEYKSIVVKREDWVKVDNENYKRDIELSELSLCNVHEIDMGIDDNWIVNSEVVTSSGDRVAIAQWSTYIQTQTGERIKLYIQDGIEVQELLLKVKRNNTYEGFEFQETFNSIPTEISLTKHENEISDLSSSTYNYSSAENYDVVQTSFEYRIDNTIHSWKIYQTASSTSNYELPEFPIEYLDETILMKPSLMDPERFHIQFYSIEADADQVFNETGIDRQFQCINFNSSYESYEF